MLQMGALHPKSLHQKKLLKIVDPGLERKGATKKLPQEECPCTK